MDAPPVVNSQPAPSSEELSSLELRLAKGSLTESETLSWLSRMIAAYKELLPEQPAREISTFSASRGNG